MRVLSFFKYLQYRLESGSIFSTPGWRSINWTCFPTTQKGIFWRSREICFRKFFWGQAPRPPSFSQRSGYLYLFHYFRICLIRLAHVRFPLSRSKLSVFPFRAIDWRMGSYFLSQNEDKWWKIVFLLQNRAFSDVLEQVILEFFCGGSPQTPESLIPLYVKRAFLSMTYIWKTLSL